MFCKYCGERINTSNNVCPNCGKDIRLEGGNGFWDIMSQSSMGTHVSEKAHEPAPMNDVLTRILPDPKTLQENSQLKNKVAELTKRIKREKNIRKLLLMFCLVSFVAAVSMAVLSISLKDRLDEAEDYNETLQKRLDEINDDEVQFDTATAVHTEEMPPDVVTQSQKETPAVASTPSTEKSSDVTQEPDPTEDSNRYKLICHNPTDELSLSRKKDEEICAFCVKSTEDAEFVWQKKTENGMTDIEFDEEGRNINLGIRVESGRDISRLYIFDCKEEAAGDYCCKVTSCSTGETEISRTASLTYAGEKSDA